MIDTALEVFISGILAAVLRYLSQTFRFFDPLKQSQVKGSVCFVAARVGALDTQLVAQESAHLFHRRPLVRLSLPAAEHQSVQRYRKEGQRDGCGNRTPESRRDTMSSLLQSGKGVSPIDVISHIKTPKDQTSEA